ncbi:MAG: NAD-dependent 4,6-dehydratase LegB [Elusimicrobiaceae bacterium]
MTKTALVTGAGGFIGSTLTEMLAEKGYKVRALVHYNSLGRRGWLDSIDEQHKPSVAVTAGDICDYHMVRELAEGADVIFHLAALIGIPYSYHAPQSYVDVNVNGTLNVLQAAREAKVAKVIHTSTSETYGTAQFVPITELHPVNPQSPYAATKAGADFLALSYCRSFGLPVTVMRPFNTYGPRQSARAVIPTIISQIAAGKLNIKLGAIKPTRDLNFVRDTARGFIAAAETAKGAGEVINLGSNKEISIGELAELIAEIMNVRITIECDEQRLRPEKSEVERLWADASKAEALLGWKPEYSLRHGLDITISWLLKNAELYRHDVYNI